VRSVDGRNREVAVRVFIDVPLGPDRCSLVAIGVILDA